jgi:hypothetical protein
VEPGDRPAPINLQEDAVKFPSMKTVGCQVQVPKNFFFAYYAVWS